MSENEHLSDCSPIELAAKYRELETKHEQMALDYAETVKKYIALDISHMDLILEFDYLVELINGIDKITYELLCPKVRF